MGGIVASDAVLGGGIGACFGGSMGAAFFGDSPGLNVLGGGTAAVDFDDGFDGSVGILNFSESFGGIVGNAKAPGGNLDDSCTLETTGVDPKFGGETGPFHLVWVSVLSDEDVFKQCTGESCGLGTLRGGTNAAVLGLMAKGGSALSLTECCRSLPNF